MENDKSLGSTVPPGSEMAVREWIIQRCTQEWIGTELQYEDFPLLAPAFQLATMHNSIRPDLMTRDEMIVALDFCNDHWPDEFKGHNVMNCRCASHVALRESTSTARSHTETGATLQPNIQNELLNILKLAVSTGHYENCKCDLMGMHHGEHLATCFVPLAQVLIGKAEGR